MFELDHIIPPPTAFYFNVQSLAPFPIPDMAFLEVSGLTMELETIEIEEGGGPKVRLPGYPKHGNLVCKRPMKRLGLSALSMWTTATMQMEYTTPVLTSEIMVTLLGAFGEPTCGWLITDAYPVKWEVGAFDSKKNDVAIETIEFAYYSVNRVL